VENLLNYEQAAKRLGLKIGTLYALVSTKKIPHIRLSKRIVRFDATALDAWLAAHTVEGEK